jgi:hypothetical protein
MANAMGLGSFFLPTEARSSLGSLAALDSDAEAAAAPAPDPELLRAEALWGQIAQVLAAHPNGLTAGDLRVELDLEPAEVQAGLVRGVETKRARRLGARRTLRYVLNPH